jgi:hypothetical protein
MIPAQYYAVFSENEKIFVGDRMGSQGSKGSI